MLASLLYVKFKTGHIVAAKCVFENSVSNFKQSSQYIKCTSDGHFVPGYLLCFSKSYFIMVYDFRLK